MTQQQRRAYCSRRWFKKLVKSVIRMANDPELRATLEDWMRRTLKGRGVGVIPGTVGQ